MIIKSDGVGATSIIRGMLAFLEPRNEQNVLGSGEHNSKEIEISEHMGLFHAEIHTQIRGSLFLIIIIIIIIISS